MRHWPAAIFLTGVLGASLRAQPPQAPTLAEQMDGMFQSVVSRTLGGLVVVEAAGALGTGFLADVRGYFVTNHHVVEKALIVRNPTVTVRTRSGDSRSAKVVWADETLDLALLRVTGADLTTLGVKPLELADSDKLRRGQWVIAVGHGQGLEDSATAGIVSHPHRRNKVLEQKAMLPFLSFIQMDAAINQGNSGGPLVDLRGRVVGVNFLKFQGEGIEGLNFAIPSNVVKRAIRHLDRYARIRWPFLGMKTRELSRSEAQNLGVEGGMLIEEVVRWGPARHYGLKSGDVILSLDGDSVTDQPSWENAWQSKDPGQKVALRLMGKPAHRNASLVLGERLSRTLTLADVGLYGRMEDEKPWVSPAGKSLMGLESSGELVLSASMDPTAPQAVKSLVDLENQINLAATLDKDLYLKVYPSGRQAHAVTLSVKDAVEKMFETGGEP